MEGEALQQYIQEFVQKTGVSIDSIESTEVVGQQMYNILTPHSKLLIGPHGEHLRALNYIIRRSVEVKTGEKETKFMIDVNSYQKKHIQEIEQKAKLLAERVRTFKSSADMTPMSAYERMIIHSIFSNDPEITTSSEGFGQNRHVILSYKK